MASIKVDTSLVRGLVAAARAGGDLEPAAAWARDGVGSVNDLEPGLALAAIEAAVQLGQGGALARAKADARNKDVRKAAAAAVHKLKSAGQKVEEVASTHVWSLKPEDAPNLPPVAFVGYPETDGYFPFMLLSTGDRETVVFAGYAGGAQGHREVEHTHLSRTGRRGILDDARRDKGLTEVPFHEALQIVELAFNNAGSQPRGWDHLPAEVPEGVLNSARLLDAFARQEQALDVDKLALAVPLLEGATAVLLMPDAGVFTALSVQVEAAKGLDLDAREPLIASASQVACDECLAGPARQTWAQALDVVAYLSEQRGLEDVRVPARATALALRAGLKGSEVPYVQGIVERMLMALTENPLPTFDGDDLGDGLAPELGGEG